MTTRILPKRIRAAIEKHPDRFDLKASCTEQDDFGDTNGWSHWIYLQPGWRNAVQDPMCPVHIIHEATRDMTYLMQQIRGIKPCDCEECRRELEAAP